MENRPIIAQDKPSKNQDGQANRSVVTIAVGKIGYLKLAENLLRSFRIWNHQNDIHFLLITDNTDFFSAYNTLPRVQIQNINLDEKDKSFTSKFKLFDHVSADENIFIDCDCLIYKDLSPVFDEFKGMNFSAIGNTISTGVFFCDVKTMMAKFNIAAMPKFVGCLYYLKNNSTTKSIFEKASQLKSEYDSLGFVRLNGKENEEPLLAVAMAIYNEKLLPNNGKIKVDMMYYEKIESNILTGSVKAKGPYLDITGCESIPEIAYPAILHFNDVFADGYIYKSELFRLNHSTYNKFLLAILVWALFLMPERLKNRIKSIFRPIYHYFWGYRKVRMSTRLD